VILGGLISSIKHSQTKNPQPGKPNRYAMFDLEDVDGIIRSIVWPEQFAEMGHLVTPDNILVVRGVIDRRGGEEANLIVNELIPLDQLDSRYTTGIVVRIHEDRHGPETIGSVREIVRGYPGNSELQLFLHLDSGTRVVLRSHRTKLDVTRELRERLDGLLGPGNLQLITTPPKPTTDRGPRRQWQSR
jgi:DNA polymerase-3 subunit alpha